MSFSAFVLLLLLVVVVVARFSSVHGAPRGFLSLRRDVVAVVIVANCRSGSDGVVVEVSVASWYLLLASRILLFVAIVVVVVVVAWC